jgi:hypothetical protein
MDKDVMAAVVRDRPPDAHRCTGLREALAEDLLPWPTPV